ncbi:hypothetical protein M3Y94_00545600 [Aphelenchoides besseyi]|nr:hypothetical protein M3Y94_00545600 [Aphelenchoides besseyi]
MNPKNSLVSAFYSYLQDLKFVLRSIGNIENCLKGERMNDVCVQNEHRHLCVKWHLPKAKADCFEINHVTDDWLTEDNEKICKILTKIQNCLLGNIIAICLPKVTNSDLHSIPCSIINAFALLFKPTDDNIGPICKRFLLENSLCEDLNRND